MMSVTDTTQLNCCRRIRFTKACCIVVNIYDSDRKLVDSYIKMMTKRPISPPPAATLREEAFCYDDKNAKNDHSENEGGRNHLQGNRR